MFKAALALSSRMFSHGLVCKGAAEYLGVCTSVMDCPWLRWLEVSWRHATVTTGIRVLCHRVAFQFLLGPRSVSGAESGGRKSTFQSHGGGVGYEVLKRQDGEWMWRVEHPEQVRK